ncbi:MAG: hypothetical protein M1337_01870 [Actinobacteria bacterium]|nr:hypothetical protein [Actinomycetota bacterium]
MPDQELRRELQALAPRDVGIPGEWELIQRRTRGRRRRERTLLAVGVLAVLAVVGVGANRAYEALRPHPVVVITARSIAGAGSATTTEEFGRQSYDDGAYMGYWAGNVETIPAKSRHLPDFFYNGPTPSAPIFRDAQGNLLQQDPATVKKPLWVFGDEVRVGEYVDRIRQAMKDGRPVLFYMAPVADAVAALGLVQQMWTDTSPERLIVEWLPWDNARDGTIGFGSWAGGEASPPWVFRMLVGSTLHPARQTGATLTTSTNPKPYLDEAAVRSAELAVQSYLVAVRSNNPTDFAKLLAHAATGQADALLHEERAQLQAAGEQTFLNRLLKPLVWAGDGYLIQPTTELPAGMDEWIRADPHERTAIETTMMDDSVRWFWIQHNAETGAWLVLPTTATVIPSASVRELTVGAPDLSTPPETVIGVGWGTGPGEVSLGQAFGHTKGGPDLMAVSPDGKTIAVYDQYAVPRRVNFYAGGVPVGAVTLKDYPDAMAINDRREVYALYQSRPNSSVLHLSASGEVLQTLHPGGVPMGPLVWAGSTLFCSTGGGTENAGYLWVMSDGPPVPRSAGPNTSAGVVREFPLASGFAALEKDPAGGFLLTVTEGDASTTTAHLTLPPAIAGSDRPGGSISGSAFDGLPVIVFFSSFPDGRASFDEFVAVNISSGWTKTATVRFDWKVPGGGVAIGPDGVYVMRLDYATGMQLLRVPFK